MPGRCPRHLLTSPYNHTHRGLDAEIQGAVCRVLTLHGGTLLSPWRLSRVTQEIIDPQPMGSPLDFLPVSQPPSRWRPSGNTTTHILLVSFLDVVLMNLCNARRPFPRRPQSICSFEMCKIKFFLIDGGVGCSHISCAL